MIDVFKPTQKVIFLCVHPKYIHEFLYGQKTIELRKQKPSLVEGDGVILYSTSPRKSIVATATIGELIVCSPAAMWEKHQHRLGVDKTTFDAYFSNANKSIGIPLENINKIDHITLTQIRHKIGQDFTPPQGFRYFDYQTANLIVS